MLHLIFLVGLPGSGKTFFADSLFAFLKDSTILSKDQFRYDKKGHYLINSEENENKVKTLFFTHLLIAAASPKNKYIIIDSTNRNADEIMDVLTYLDNFEKKVLFVIFEHRTVEEHLLRTKHGDYLTTSLLMDMMKDYLEISSDIPEKSKIRFDGFDIKDYGKRVEEASKEIRYMFKDKSFQALNFNHLFSGFPTFLRRAARKRFLSEIDFANPPFKIAFVEKEPQEEEKLKPFDIFDVHLNHPSKEEWLKETGPHLLSEEIIDENSIYPEVKKNVIALLSEDENEELNKDDKEINN